MNFIFLTGIVLFHSLGCANVPRVCRGCKNLVSKAARITVNFILLDLVGEATMYVQGESLKIAADLSLDRFS